MLHRRFAVEQSEPVRRAKELGGILPRGATHARFEITGLPNRGQPFLKALEFPDIRRPQTFDGGGAADSTMHVAVRAAAAAIMLPSETAAATSGASPMGVGVWSSQDMTVDARSGFCDLPVGGNLKTGVVSEAGDLQGSRHA